MAPDDKDGTKARAAKARSDALSPERRSEIAREAARARWHDTDTEQGEDDLLAPEPTMPVAVLRGTLNIVGLEVPCYVLNNGAKIIGRTSATEVLTGIKGGGALEKYLGVKALEPYINKDLVLERLVPFRLLEVEGLEKAVKGLPADLMVEVCQGFAAALQASMDPQSTMPRLTDRQVQMAIKASMFLSACAKVGLEALIDEATGNQYLRAQDALQVKLAAYLEDEMRKWERTFPDELWQEFARLTSWKGPLHRRPKYWGKLVMELIYDKLDKDVADWLREHAPAPRHGQNYHQWLSGQYGLEKLVKHIWMIVGMAKACESMNELRDKVAALEGKVPVQLRLFVSPPASERN